MIVDKAGEIIADALTMSPSLSGIPSASALLDTSNFTIQAISFGKAASQYSGHGHNADLSSLVLGDGVIRVFSQQTTSVSSYQSSAVSAPGIVWYPHPHDTRLEKDNTVPIFSTWDIGHNLNVIATSADTGLNFSAALVGCYPTSSTEGTPVAMVSSFSLAEDVIASGYMRSPMNEASSMDQSGFITMIVSSVAAGNAKNKADWASGLILAADSDFSSLGPLKYRVALSAGDFGLPNVFGGVYQMGLWCLDVKAMAKKGLTPPFAFSPINNTRIYRLFAKKTFTQDLTWGEDSTSCVFGQSLTTRLDPAYQWNELYIEWRLRF